MQVSSASPGPVDEDDVALVERTDALARTLGVNLISLAPAVAAFLVMGRREIDVASAGWWLLIMAGGGLAQLGVFLARHRWWRRSRLGWERAVAMVLSWLGGGWATAALLVVGDGIDERIFQYQVLAWLAAVSAVGIISLTPSPVTFAPFQLTVWGVAIVAWTVQARLGLTVAAVSFLITGLLLFRTNRGAFDRAVALRRSADRLADELADREAIARSVVENAGEAIWTLDDRGRVLTANAAADILTGRDTTGERLSRVVPGLQLAQGSHTFETATEAPDGRAIDLVASVAPVDTATVRYTVIATDISDQKQLQRDLVVQATHDPLTGLANRAALTRRLTDVAEAAVTVLYVDLDCFKSVNDTMGHAAGDELLRLVAGRLRDTARDVDMVARIGGDEFVVVIDGDEEANGHRLGERLCVALDAPFVLSGRPVEVSASVGVAAGVTGDGGSDLLSAADGAMYSAKRTGRGLASHDDAIDADPVAAARPAPGPTPDAVPTEDRGRRSPSRRGDRSGVDEHEQQLGDAGLRAPDAGHP